MERRNLVMRHGVDSLASLVVARAKRRMNAPKLCQWLCGRVDGDWYRNQHNGCPPWPGDLDCYMGSTVTLAGVTQCVVHSPTALVWSTCRIFTQAHCCSDDLWPDQPDLRECFGLLIYLYLLLVSKKQERDEQKKALLMTFKKGDNSTRRRQEEQRLTIHTSTTSWHLWWLFL